MRLSRFTPCGHLSFSSREPRGKQIYDALAAAEGTEWLSGEDGPADAERFATAMSIASAQLTVERAGRQWDARYAQEMLPDLEEEYGIVPPRGATLAERRDAVAARQASTPTAQLGSVLAALRAILGASLHSVEFSGDSRSVWPQMGDPSQHWAGIDRDFSVWIVRPSSGGSVNSIVLEFVGGEQSALSVGSKVLIGAGVPGQAESVIVATAQGYSTGETFGRAVTTNGVRSHSPGEYALTGQFPFWCSDQRVWSILVSSGVLSDPVALRRVHVEMAHLVRAVSLWQVLPMCSAGSYARRFRMGVPALGPACCQDILSAEAKATPPFTLQTASSVILDAWDAADPELSLSGANLVTWSAWHGLGHVLGPKVTAPTYSATAWGGSKPGIVFGGSGGAYVTAIPSATYTVGATRSFVIACQSTASTNVSTVLEIGGWVGSALHAVRLVTLSTGAFALIVTDNTGAQVTQAITMPSGVTHASRCIVGVRLVYGAGTLTGTVSVNGTSSSFSMSCSVATWSALSSVFVVGGEIDYLSAFSRGFTGTVSALWCITGTTIPVTLTASLSTLYPVT